MSQVAEDQDGARTESGARAVVRLAVLGLGPVGQGVVRAAMEDPRFEVAACVDPHPDREALASGCGFDGGVYVSADQLPDASGVAIVCTQSAVSDIAPSVLALLERDYDVVTSCEEMIAPQLGDHDVIAALDEAARRANRTVIGAGVNPGFVMDLLPLIATMPTRQVDEVRVLRRVDVSKRRQRLQDKVGVGISLEEFSRRRDAGAVGHVGLRASLVFLANAIGWDGDSAETVEPVLDVDGTTSRGVRHVGEVRDSSGVVRVRGLLEMYAGAPEVDEIEIGGTPPVKLQLVGGVSGDEATISAILNVAQRVGEMHSGLKTLDQVPPPAWGTTS